jgi:hypothetical protein
MTRRLAPLLGVGVADTTSGGFAYDNENRRDGRVPDVLEPQLLLVKT